MIMLATRRVLESSNCGVDFLGGVDILFAAY